MKLNFEFNLGSSSSGFRALFHLILVAIIYSEICSAHIIARVLSPEGIPTSQRIQVKISRPWSLADFTKFTGLKIEQISQYAEVSLITERAVLDLPSEFFSGLSEKQLDTIIVTCKGLVNFLNHLSKRHFKIVRVLFQTFGPAKFQPASIDYPLLCPKVFQLMDPWTTLCNGPVSPEQFLSLVHFNPKEHENIKEECMRELQRYINLLPRSDLDHFKVAMSIGVNLNAAAERKTFLPQVTMDRLILILDKFTEISEQQ